MPIVFYSLLALLQEFLPHMLEDATREWGPTVNPAHLADLLWDMHSTKGEPEAIYPGPAG
jgi:hypothetical protein